MQHIVRDDHAVASSEAFRYPLGEVQLFFDPYEKKLLGITAMTSLLGKKKFNELLSGFITKPQGKPTLVPESDKRPALNTAKDDFSEE